MSSIYGKWKMKKERTVHVQIGDSHYAGLHNKRNNNNDNNGLIRGQMRPGYIACT